MSNLKKNSFQKSLERLQGMALEKSQLHHTASDSNPGAWAGGTQEDLDESSGGKDVNIDDAGTDYNGVRKSLAAKVEKSQALTPAEVLIAKGQNPQGLIKGKIDNAISLTPAEKWAYKSQFTGISKASTKPVEGAPMSGEDDSASSAPKTNAGANTDDEIEPDAKKSFDSVVDSSIEIQKGLEISPFLYELTRAFGSSASSLEDAVKSLGSLVKSLSYELAEVKKSVAANNAHQDEFNKSLATAVVGIGEAVSATADATAAQAHMPVSAPKSQMRQGDVQVLAKSQDASEPELSKSQVSDIMFDLVKSGELNHMEVLKFETSGQIDPKVKRQVISRYNSKN